MPVVAGENRMRRFRQSDRDLARATTQGKLMKLIRRKFLHLAAGAAALPFAPHIARAQAYPSQPVRLIIGFPPGSASDILARIIGQWLTERLGQPVIIEAKPGASGNISVQTA